MKCRRTIAGRVIWMDSDNEYNLRPDETEIVLNRNGLLLQSAVVPSTGDGLFSFDCLPIHDSVGNQNIYRIDEPIVPDGYTKKVQRNKVINSLDTIKITYVFNNIVHSDYTGKIYDKVEYINPKITPATIKKDTETFPEYVEGCTFVGWNTLANATGTYYYADESVMLSADLTLYAIWRSCIPIVNQIYAGATTISGRGIVGINGELSSIMVSYSSMLKVGTYVNSSGTWSASVPTQARPLTTGTILEITQTESGKLVSDIVSARVV